MSSSQTGFVHSIPSTTLGDLIERVLDKGVVISGDIKIKLVEVELLTIQIRLVICSVDRAREIGIDWWRSDSHFSALARDEDRTPEAGGRLLEVEERLARLEGRLSDNRQTTEAAHG